MYAKITILEEIKCTVQNKIKIQNKIAKHQRAEILLTNLMLNNNRIIN